MKHVVEGKWVRSSIFISRRIESALLCGVSLIRRVAGSRPCGQVLCASKTSPIDVDLLLCARPPFLIFAFVLLITTIGCEPPKVIRPIKMLRLSRSLHRQLESANPFSAEARATLPIAKRKGNYSRGSCYHAAFDYVLRQQGFDDLANSWTQKYRGSQSTFGLIFKAKAAGLDVRYTQSGDEEFLQWASDTGRAIAIGYPSARSGGLHAVAFIGYVGNDACIVDNNSPKAVRRVEKSKFLEMWKSQRGGTGVTIAHTPLPPKPWVAYKGA